MNGVKVGLGPETCSASNSCKVRAQEVETLGSSLDRRIANARLNLEQLCITKAKAEAMQMLETPMEFMRQATW
jgi:hypothetical protein